MQWVNGAKINKLGGFLLFGDVFECLAFGVDGQANVVKLFEGKTKSNAIWHSFIEEEYYFSHFIGMWDVGGKKSRL